MQTVAGTALSIEATDGYALGARRFAAEAPRATVIIAGASATPQSYYRHFASHLAGQADLETLTFDYRGMGAQKSFQDGILVSLSSVIETKDELCRAARIIDNKVEAFARQY
jgi:alpha-beta hydrolase superfamily lysophospholipase